MYVWMYVCMYIQYIHVCIYTYIYISLSLSLVVFIEKQCWPYSQAQSARGVPLLPSKQAWPWGHVLVRERRWKPDGVLLPHHHRSSGQQLLGPGLEINLREWKNLRFVYLISESHKNQSKQRTKQCRMEYLRKNGGSSAQSKTNRHTKPTERPAGSWWVFVLTIFKSWFDNSQSAALGLAPVYSIFMSVRLVRFVAINLDYSHNWSQTRKSYRANKINVSRIGLESAVHHLWLQPLYAYRMKSRILTNTQQVPPKK